MYQYSVCNSMQQYIKLAYVIVITFNGGICCWLKRCFFDLVSGCLPTAETKSGLCGVTLVREKQNFTKNSSC